MINRCDRTISSLSSSQAIIPGPVFDRETIKNGIPALFKAYPTALEDPPEPSINARSPCISGGIVSKKPAQSVLYPVRMCLPETLLMVIVLTAPVSCAEESRLVNKGRICSL